MVRTLRATIGGEPIFYCLEYTIFRRFFPCGVGAKMLIIDLPPNRNLSSY